MENSHRKAVKVLEGEIRNLKQEIDELKNAVEVKEAKLIEISTKNLDDLDILRKENKYLKHLIEKERKAHAKTEEENKDLTKEMERFKAGLVCDKCDYKSELFTEMKVHLTTHNETKNCATCDQRYKSEVNLSTHKSSVLLEDRSSQVQSTILPHNQSMLVCDICKLVFQKDFDLKLHKTSKHAAETFGFSVNKQRKCSFTTRFTRNYIPSK